MHVSKNFFLSVIRHYKIKSQHYTKRLAGDERLGHAVPAPHTPLTPSDGFDHGNPAQMKE